MLWALKTSSILSKSALDSSSDLSLYLHEPIAAEGVCLSAVMVWGFSAEMSNKSSLKTPNMPLVAPITRLILLDFIASWMTPQTLELITAVGPPDCATIALAFDFIGITSLNFL